LTVRSLVVPDEAEPGTSLAMLFVRRNVKRALLVVPLLALVGCGGLAADREPGRESQHEVAGLGLGLELPPGWTARILIGAGGRPVLHAASFPLSPNDDDKGEVARETIGSRGQMYVNVRDLGPGESGSSVPVAFQRSDFGPPPPGPGSRCCFITVASRDVAASGHVYRVSVTSGSDEPPSAAAVAKVNAVLATLSLRSYEPKPATPARGGEHLAGYGIDLALSPGWDGRVFSGVMEVASFDLSRAADASGPISVGRNDVAIRLLENGGSDARFVTARLPLELAPTEFVPPGPGFGDQVPALTGRSFVASGRQFVLWAFAGSLPPNPTALAAANEALATLRIEPGDFYPGEVQPARSRRRRTGIRARAVPPRSSQTASRPPARHRQFRIATRRTSSRPTRRWRRCRPTASRSSPGSLATLAREASCLTGSPPSRSRKPTTAPSRASHQTAPHTNSSPTFPAASTSRSGSSSAAHTQPTSRSTAPKPNSTASACPIDERWLTRRRHPAS